MNQEALFTTISYKCVCEDGWFTIEQIKEKLCPPDSDILERPIHLKFRDSKQDGDVFVGNMDYFDHCPKDRKFKMDLTMGNKVAISDETEYANFLYGYSIINDQAYFLLFLGK